MKITRAQIMEAFEKLGMNKDIFSLIVLILNYRKGIRADVINPKLLKQAKAFIEIDEMSNLLGLTSTSELLIRKVVEFERENGKN